MTAAYANDPITQEQHAEKKISTIMNKTLYNKKEEITCEENAEIDSVEKIKLVTGGQDQKEIPVNQERPPLNTLIFVEQNDEAILECKASSEIVEFLEKNENIVTISDKEEVTINSTEIQNVKVSVDGDTIIAKSASFDSNVSVRFDVHFNESDAENIISEARGNESLTKNNFSM